MLKNAKKVHVYFVFSKKSSNFAEQIVSDDEQSAFDINRRHDHHGS